MRHARERDRVDAEDRLPCEIFSDCAARQALESAMGQAPSAAPAPGLSSGCVVLGAQWGDEGKGHDGARKETDSVCEKDALRRFW